MKYFITFGAGGQNYYDAGNRLINQARNLNKGFHPLFCICHTNAKCV